MQHKLKTFFFVSLFTLTSVFVFSSESKESKTVLPVKSPVPQKVNNKKAVPPKNTPEKLEVKELFEKHNSVKTNSNSKTKEEGTSEKKNNKLPSPDLKIQAPKDKDIKTEKSKPKEAPLNFNDKNLYSKNDDLDVYLYSYLDKLNISIDLINMVISSPCSKSPDVCSSKEELANAVKTLQGNLKQKYPQSNKIVPEEMIKFFLINASSLKDKLGETYLKKIIQTNDDIKIINKSLFKEKESEIISKIAEIQNSATKEVANSKSKDIPLEKNGQQEGIQGPPEIIPEGNKPETITPSSPKPESVIKIDEKTVFVSERDGNPEIYIMNSDGSGQVRLTDSPSYDIMPAWSPDGTKIAFVSEREGNPEIYAMNSDGSGQVRLTNNSSYDYSPAWSPDGTKIAFVSNREVSQNNGNSVVKISYKIFVMNADGSSQAKLFDNSMADESPKWSPDRTRMLFVSYRDGNPEIYVINLDGTNLVRLTNEPSFDLMPNWSPDGSKIVFRSDRDGNAEIYTMNPDGSDQVRITYNPFADEYPNWSPDGNKIIFVSKRDNILDTEGILTNEIYIINQDGSNFNRLTNNLSDDYFPGWTKLH